ncbi:MAG: hypothetical protein AB1645_02780 [Bacillota bacterium]|jgi:hypothetical protein
MSVRRARPDLRLSRPLPPGATTLVREADRVTPETIIATGRSHRRVLRLPAGGAFELLKKPGDPVKAGETIAVTEELFGLGLRELVSPLDGVLETVNSRGTALVLAEGDDEIRALVPGVVAAVSSSEVVLTVHGEVVRGWFGLGEPVAAELWAAGELLTEAAVRLKLGPAVRGRIVLAESYVLPSVLPILAQLGAAGLICGGLDFGPLWELIGPGGPHPAGRGLPTFIVTDGFGVHRIRPETRRILARAEGRMVYAAGPMGGRLRFTGPPHAEVVVTVGDS